MAGRRRCGRRAARRCPARRRRGGTAGLELALIALGMVSGRRVQLEPEPRAYDPRAAHRRVARPPPETGAQTQLTGEPHGGRRHAVARDDIRQGFASINPNNLGPGRADRALGGSAPASAPAAMADVYLARTKGEAGFEKTRRDQGHARAPRAEPARGRSFLDEARLAALIHHLNVVGIEDLGKIGGDYVIVMDYVEGVDLERLLGSARAATAVPLDVALGVLVRICDGLHAAHTRRPGRLAPRDHPPRRQERQRARLAAGRRQGRRVRHRQGGGAGHLTIAGETKGTPSMMAPGAARRRAGRRPRRRLLRGGRRLRARHRRRRQPGPGGARAPRHRQLAAPAAAVEPAAEPTAGARRAAARRDVLRARQAAARLRRARSRRSRA